MGTHRAAVDDEKDYITGRPYFLLHEQLNAAHRMMLDALRERDIMVGALTKCYPSHLLNGPDSADTRMVVCVHLPTGQAEWVIHESCWHLFLHLTPDSLECDGWDGHSLEERYRRVSALDTDWRI